MNQSALPVPWADAIPYGATGVKAAGGDSVNVSLSEVLASLSHALDLTEGQPIGHTVRTCIIGMRLAEELDLSAFDRVALYGALLLKDAGCSGNVSRVSEVLQPTAASVPWHPVMADGNSAGNDGAGFLARFSRRFRKPAAVADPAVDIVARAERSEGIAARLGFSRATTEATRSIDEHWNGEGYPDGKIGHEIPRFSRIILLAQTLDAFHTELGVAAALRIARERSGTWFEPSLVRIVRGWRDDVGWWESLKSPDATAAALALEPTQHTRFVDDSGLDEIARAFADIIDSKSPYTDQHSTNVARYARKIGRELGLERDDAATLNRAALLHDVGKLGIASGILNKAGPLTADERRQMEMHPRYTWEILQRVSAFAGFARTAAFHHEKLDGSGYPWGVKGDDLDTAARTLAVADMYEALTASRPYRAALSRDEALKIINATAVCPIATEALASATRASAPALELEVSSIRRTR